MSNQNVAENVKKHGAREHDHMLACGASYFEASFPAEWEALQSLPVAVAIQAMRAKYQSVAAA